MDQNKLLLQKILTFDYMITGIAVYHRKFLLFYWKIRKSVFQGKENMSPFKSAGYYFKICFIDLGIFNILYNFNIKSFIPSTHIYFQISYAEEA